jgi:hypothetical protein
MAGMTGSTAGISRRRILVEGGRILAVSFVGWAAGTALVVALASGSLASDVGLLVLAAALWAAIPAAILRLLACEPAPTSGPGSDHAPGRSGS